MNEPEPAPGPPLLEALSLVKIYGELRAVSELSFDVRAGEIVGLVGPNGAGKTSTLRCVSGIIPPNEGQVRIGHADHRHADRRHIRRQQDRADGQVREPRGVLPVGEERDRPRLRLLDRRHARDLHRAVALDRAADARRDVREPHGREL